MKKKIICILALTMVLTACGSKNAESDSKKEAALETIRTGGESNFSEEEDNTIVIGSADDADATDGEVAE
ncbi:MAG: hypothetical protein J5504_11915 [Butyrivibrio sp.]|nr:hypothetical protein [Butyrivibrio sp.]MBR5897763.1 hypothetical protein [Lachnospiraceae bacterium]